MDQKYRSFAVIPDLEKEAQQVLDIFDRVQKGAAQLSGIGLNINTAQSTKQVDALTKRYEELAASAATMRDQLAKSAGKLSGLNTEQSKYAESLKQVTALVKGLTAEEVKQEKMRQGAYTDLVNQKLANQELNKSIQLRIKLRNAEEGSVEQLRLRYEKLQGIIIKLSEAQRNTARGQDLIKQADTMKNKINDLQKSFGNFRDNVGRYSESLGGAFEKVANEISKLQAKQQQLTNLSKSNPIGFQLSGGAAELNKTNAALEQLNVTAQIGFRTNQSYDVTVKQLAKSYSNLAAAGNVSKEFLDEFKKDVAEAKDSAADLKDEINALSSDTRKLDLAVGTVSVLASAMEAAAGAAALAGANTEDVQRITMKLVAIQSIANGVREVGEQLTKRGTAANKAYNFVLSQGKIIMDANAAATARWGAALKLTGIGLLITGISFLVTKMGLFTDATEEASKAAEELSKRLERVNEMTEKISKNLEVEGRLQLENLKQRLAANRKFYDDDAKNAEQALREKRQLSEEEIDQLREQEALRLQIQSEAAVRLGAAQDKLIEYRELKNKGLNRLRRVTIDGKTEEQLKAELDEYKKFYDEQTEAAIDASNALRIALEQNETEITEDQAKAREERRKQILEDNENEKKAALELLKFRKNLIIETASLSADYAENPLGETGRRKAAEDAAAAERAIIDAQRKYDLSQRRLTASQILLIREKAANDMIKVEERLQTRLIQIRVDAINIQKQMEQDSIAQFEADQIARAQAQTEAQQKAFDREQATIEKNRDIELTQNAENYKNNLKTFEEYQRRREEIQENYQRILLQSQLRFLEQTRDNLKAAGEDTAAIDAAIANAQAQLAENNIKKGQETVEQHKNIAEQIKQNYYDAFKQIGDAFTNVFGAIFERRKQELEDEKEEIDKNKEAEIAAIEASGDSEEKKAARIKIVEAKAQAEKDARDRKQRQLDRQRAMFERSFKAFQIATDTIMAVNKIKANIAIAASNVATLPLVPVFSSQLVLTIASGAAALAGVLAQPLPGYRKGGVVDKTKLAEVAEDGPELAVDTQGNMTLYKKRQVAQLTKGTRVFTKQVTSDILRESSKEISSGGDIFVKQIKDEDLQPEILHQLEMLNRKPAISVHNHNNIESTVYYQKQMKH